MFNIKKGIYVSYPEDVATMSDKSRMVLLTPNATIAGQDSVASADNPAESGVVFQYNSYLEMIALQFDGSDRKFYDWLQNESKVWIVVSRDDDYARLFAMVMIELRERYALSDGHVEELINVHKLKNFFVGRPSDYDIADAFRLLGNGTYKPVGGLVDNPQDLSLEYVLYMYKHGYVSKEVGDQKVSTISQPMLRGLISSVTTSIRNDMAIDRIVLKKFLNTPNIDSIGEAVTAIKNDPLLFAMFFKPKSIDLNDSGTLDRCLQWTRLCIEHEVDYPEEHARQLYEHDLFYKLFETNDVDLVLNNIIPFTAHDFVGFVGSNGQKFNIILLTTLYPDTEPLKGAITVAKTGTTWKWNMVDEEQNELMTSNTFPTKKAALANIDAIKSYSQFASVSS